MKPTLRISVKDDRPTQTHLSTVALTKAEGAVIWLLQVPMPFIGIGSGELIGSILNSITMLTDKLPRFLVLLDVVFRTVWTLLAATNARLSRFALLFLRNP